MSEKWTKEELLSVWKQFTEGQDFELNLKSEMVSVLADGVLSNQEKYGFKFCPCRVRDGSHERDLALLCPCNFKVQDKWRNQKECWCGLFVLRGREEK